MKISYSSIKLFSIHPRQFFSILADKPQSLKLPLVIISFVSLLIVISPVPGLPNIPLIGGDKMEQGFFIGYFILAFIFIYGLISTSIIIKSLWIKLGLSVLSTKTKFIALFSFLAYAEVPIIFKLVLDIFFSRTSHIMNPKSHRWIFYSKTSLAQFFLNYAISHRFLFYILREINPFDIWSFVLGVFAVSALGKISIRKSFMIIFLFWIVSFLPYFFVKNF